MVKLVPAVIATKQPLKIFQPPAAWAQKNLMIYLEREKKQYNVNFRRRRFVWKERKPEAVQLALTLTHQSQKPNKTSSHWTRENICARDIPWKTYVQEIFHGEETTIECIVCRKMSWVV